MNFNSLEYIVLLAATLVLFFRFRGSMRIFILGIASVVFYASWSLPLVSLIFVSAIVDFTAGRQIAKTEVSGRRRGYLILSLVTNLGLLSVFKYANFFTENVQAVFGASSTGSWIQLALPPGISFYTFQTLSYTIDVYRRRLVPASSFSRFFLFVAFFPQLVAGPIERASNLLPQFDRAPETRWSTENFLVGLRLVLYGMFKKVVIADHMARLVEPVYASPSSFDGWTVLIATYAFTLQIYCDFSAYSEIARGSARMFGIRLMRNFDQPYLSTSVTDFWRRWHISLSTWIRDYLYLPLGGNRLGLGRTVVNVILTLFLSGLWHGAAWNFVFWGLFHGLGLVVTNLVRRFATFEVSARPAALAASALGWFVTFHFAVVGWILFRVDSVSDFSLLLASIAESATSFASPSSGQGIFLAGLATFLLLSALDRRFKLLKRIDADDGLSSIFYGTLLILMLLLAERDGPQFLYFQF